MKKEKDVCNLTYGLILNPLKPRIFFQDASILIKRFFYLIKNGIPETATFETDVWFRVSMIKALSELKEDAIGYPYNMTMEEWQEEISTAINHLEHFSDDHPDYDCLDVEETIYLVTWHKDKFMEWFKENYFRLWS